MFTLSYQVSRSIEISVSSTEIDSALVDFKHWPDWSPWLCMDKQATLNYFGTTGSKGSGYQWQGKWVGEGRLSLTSIESSRLGMLLEFVKPWKSTSQVGFDWVENNGQSVTLTWTMDGQLPLWLFFMKATMQAMIGMDYQRGLLMLKDYLETGQVVTDSEVVGIVDTEAQPYVGIRQKCSIDQISYSMEQVIARLHDSVENLSLDSVGPPFTIYHVWDMKQQLCDYTLAYPVKKDLSHKDLPLKLGVRPSTRSLKIIHTGEYKHLGNAWMTGHSRIQNDKTMKLHKKIPGFEIYRSNPEETAAKDLQTEIYIPLKA